MIQEIDTWQSTQTNFNYCPLDLGQVIDCKALNEIYRVLNKKGIVYAETPFMQQVHEGAYDFARFTVLGHRYLFKDFEMIEIGGNKGPEFVLAWAVRYFFWALIRNKFS